MVLAGAGAAAGGVLRSSTSAAHGLLRDVPADAGRADPRGGRLCAGDAADRRPPARRDDRRQHRPPPRQHALRDGQPRRRGGVVDRRGARGRLRRPRRRADAGDRHGALRRARDRHRAVPVLEHDPEGVAAGRPAGRGRRRPAADLPGRLRVDAVRRRCSCSRARSIGLRSTRTAASSSRTSCGATSARWGRSSRTRRASSTCSAPSRARSSRRSSASRRATAARRGRSRCGRPSDRVDVSAIARASGGGGHRQAAGFSSDLSIDEITAFIVAAFAALPAASS